MEKRTQQIEETIGYLDMERELKRLRKYEELVQFLFSDDLCPMAILMEGEGYLMTPEEGFAIMEEYNRTGELPLCQHQYEEDYDYE